MILLRFNFLLATWILANELISIPSTGTPSARRQYAQMAGEGTELYLFGGVDGSRNYLNVIHQFHLNSQRWEKITPATNTVPIGRTVFAIFKDDQWVWINGGLSPNGKLNDMWCYDKTANIWQEIVQTGDKPPPFYRGAYTQFEFDGKKYFAIGCFGTMTAEFGNDIYMFDPETYIWQKLPKVGKVKQDGSTHSIPNVTTLCQLKFYNDYLYQWGGEAYDTSVDMYRYDLRDQSWEKLETITDSPEIVTFAGSIIRDDYFIQFPGWNGNKNTDQIFKAKLNFGTTNQVEWSEMTVDRNPAFYEGFNNDAYAFAYVEPYVYSHGGYNENFHTGNFIARLKISEEPLVTEMISPNYDMPSGRSYHTITAVGKYLYMFGGHDGRSALDELWRFDAEQETWEYEQSYGDKPSHRYGHAATAHGSSLWIWGGRNANNLYNDLWVFSAQTHEWNLMPVKYGQTPPAAEGACMISVLENIYIFGGLGENESKNSMWRYNLGLATYTEDAGETVFNVPPATSYHKWFYYDKQILVMFGLTDDLSNPKQVHSFDLTEKAWRQFDSGINSRARLVADIIDNRIIFAGGTNWNNWARNRVDIIYLDEKRHEKIDDLPFRIYAADGVYHKDSIYTFGGAGSDFIDGALVQNHASDEFSKYKLTEGNFPCSKGTYRVDGECLGCPRGTWKYAVGDEPCHQCPPGTENSQVGADHPQYCTLCTPGTYNPDHGSAYCYQCPGYASCNLGATGLDPPAPFTDDYINHQPENYEGQESKALSTSNTTLYTVFGLLSIFILAMMCSKTLQKRVHKADIYQLKHNYHTGEYMKVRQTFFGGFCTWIYYTLIIYIVTQAFLYYEYDNVVESKALIPIVVVNQNWGDIKGKLEVEVSLLKYGGDCILTQGICHPLITYSPEGVTGRFSDISCHLHKNDEWILNVVVHDCELSPISTFKFSSQESLSFAGAIKASVLAQSSIPNEDSYIEYVLNPQDETMVFLGSEASQFSFFAIPSIFESELTEDPAEDKGYHMALGTESLQGSMQHTQTLGQSGFLNIDINLESGTSALHTKRIYKFRLLQVFLTLLGSVAGLLGAIGGAMSFVEKNYEKYQIRKSDRREKKKIVQRRQLLDYYDRKIKTPKTSRGPSSFDGKIDQNSTPSSADMILSHSDEIPDDDI